MIVGVLCDRMYIQASVKMHACPWCNAKISRWQKRPCKVQQGTCGVQDVVAIKFFTDLAGFANEQRVYGIKAVSEAVGAVPAFMRNSDSSALMPNGWPFPPFTVAEKGQPLDVWMRSYSADPITSMQVQGHPCLLCFLVVEIRAPKLLFMNMHSTALAILGSKQQ